ncbi:FecR family protein [Neorhizobium sp. DT-125]|uniref:FecR family protein n=1 Tax=Neorhizobium sp. DT-125 TaxID=3396163 RepID=UPI003F1E16D4
MSTRRAASDFPLAGFPPAEISDEALLRIVRLNSGEATAADEADFAAWRSQSDLHEAAAREAEAIWNGASGLTQDPKTGAVRPAGTGPRLGRRSLLTGVAAVAAAGTFAASRFGAFAHDYETGVGVTRIVDLPDGSRVHMNAMSALDLAYEAGRRRVVLAAGQAFFDVAADPARPFEVEAGGLVMTALGTAFDIDRSLPDGATALAVTEHAVRLRRKDDAAPVAELREGQRLVIGADGGFGAIEAYDPSVGTAWMSGMYIAEARPLGQVVAALNAYHPGWIVITDASLGALGVNAVLDLRRPNASLDALAAGLPIRVRHISNYLAVISKV